MTTSAGSRPTGARTTIGAAVAVALGYAATSAIVEHASRQLLPWVLGRGFGVAAYLALIALTVVGLWLRHPWRLNRPAPTSRVLHRTHAVLAPLTLLLIIGHILALAVDRYAGVGWTGALLPGRSGYRPFAVALGTISLYAGVIVGVTALLAGWLGARVWLPIHRMASGVLVVTWFHAVLAGSDERALRPLYVATAFVVLSLGVSRRLARLPQSMMDMTAPRQEGGP